MRPMIPMNPKRREPGGGIYLPSPASVRRFLISALIFLSAFMVLMWGVQTISEKQKRLETLETQCFIPTP